MAVPKRKTSRSKKLMRRSHHAIGRPNLVRCKSCGSYIMPHRVCNHCGFYKNGVVLRVKGI